MSECHDIMERTDLLEGLSIVQARSWSSSFMCAAARKAMRSRLNARNERCCVDLSKNFALARPGDVPPE